MPIKEEWLDADAPIVLYQLIGGTPEAFVATFSKMIEQLCPSGGLQGTLHLLLGRFEGDLGEVRMVAAQLAGGMHWASRMFAALTTVETMDNDAEAAMVIQLRAMGDESDIAVTPLLLRVVAPALCEQALRATTALLNDEIPKVPEELTPSTARALTSIYMPVFGSLAAERRIRRAVAGR